MTRRFPREPLPAKRTRATFLLVSEVKLLQTWGREVCRMFNGVMPYHVGSSLKRADYRDVDVRLLLADDRYDMLADLVNVDRLNLAVSLWGQKVTGLPIDFQVQPTTDANERYSSKNGHWRSALGLSADALDESTTARLAIEREETAPKRTPARTVPGRSGRKRP